MGIFVVDGQARASIVFVVMSRGLCPRSWVIRESSARGARAKILSINISNFPAGLPRRRATGLIVT